MARCCRKCSGLCKRFTLCTVVVLITTLIVMSISATIIDRPRHFEFSLYPSIGFTRTFQKDGGVVYKMSESSEPNVICPKQNPRSCQNDQKSNSKTTVATKILNRNGEKIMDAPAHPVHPLLRFQTGIRVNKGLQTKTLPGMQSSFVFKLLPHLKNNVDALRPAFHMEGGRKFAEVVIGIPTVKRDKESYIMVTLTHLINGLTDYLNTTLIVVYVGETDITYVQETANQIKMMFPEHVESGLIEVISPSPSYYPDLDKIPDTLGDSHKRVMLRTKQNLDIIYLMAYAHTKATFYLMLEDDVIAKKTYMQEIKQFSAATSISTPNWYILEFCQVGGIGKLFKSAELVDFIVYVQIFYTNMPIDWLMESYLTDRVCTKDKESDRQFNRQFLYYSHDNPPMKTIRTSIKELLNHTLKKAYAGETFFWGVKPKKGDTIEFWFAKPTVVTSYTFRSGNLLHPPDKFYDTAVEVYPEKTKNFQVVDHFDEFGLADGKLNESFGKLLGMRLRVDKDSMYWVILSEIDIRTDAKATTPSLMTLNPLLKKLRPRYRQP